MAKIQLRKLFTNDEILNALENNGTAVAAAKALGELKNVTVSTPLLGYWKKQLANKTKKGTIIASPAKVNKAIREGMKLRDRSINDDLRKAPFVEDNTRILVIPDQHAPYHHPDTIAFLADVAAAIEPTRIINLGDEVDNHGLSMHDSDPNLDSAGMELSKAKEFLLELANLFPIMDICHSNHGSLVYRRSLKFGIPVEYIKAYRDILFDDNEGDNWEWQSKIELTLPNGDRVVFQNQSAGDTLLNAAHERANIVEGHEHGTFKVDYKKNAHGESYWVLISGCLIDEMSLAFAYGKIYAKKPVIGCSVIIDSHPVLIEMPQNELGGYTGELGGILSL